MTIPDDNATNDIENEEGSELVPRVTSTSADARHSSGKLTDDEAGYASDFDELGARTKTDENKAMASNNLYHVAPYFSDGLGPHADGIGDSRSAHALLAVALSAAWKLHLQGAAICVYRGRLNTRELIWKIDHPQRPA